MAKMSKMRQSWAWRYVAKRAAREHTGLCLQLVELLVTRRITKKTYRAMRKRIIERAREEMVNEMRGYDSPESWLVTNWIWSVRREGQIKRTRWAMEQARLTRRK